MIRYIKNEDIDRIRWDQCIDESFNGLIYAYSWYLDLLCPRQWDALVGDDYQSVFPLPFRNKAGIHYIYTPFFIQQLGAFSREHLSEAHINLFLDAIPENFRLVELNLNVRNVASGKGYSYISNLNHELSLERPYEQLHDDYSENLIRNLKKAGNYGLKIKKDENVALIINLFRAEKGREIKHWKDKEYFTFRLLLERCKKHGCLEVWSSYSDKDDLLAGIIFLRTEKRIIFLFSATGEIAKKQGAMPWLIDQFIQENSGRKLILDFEGSNDKGLARFYKSFGATQTNYQMAIRNTLPKGINFFRRRLTSSK